MGRGSHGRSFPGDANGFVDQALKGQARSAAVRRSGLCWGLALVSLACSSRSGSDTRTESPSEPAQAPASQPAEPSSSSGEDPGAPAVVVDGHVIDRKTFELELARAMFPYEQVGRSVSEGTRKRIRLNVLRALVEDAVLRQRARALKFEPSEAMKAEAWQQALRRFDTREAADAFAARMGTTLKALEVQSERSLRRQALERYVGETIEVTDAEVRRFYREHPRMFETPAQVRLEQLFFEVEPGSPHRAVGPKVQASQAAKRLKEGVDFERLLEERQDKARNTDLGFQVRSQLPEPVATEAFERMKVGETSSVLRSDFGYHIVRKTAERKAGLVPFEQVEARIEGRIRRQKIRAAVRDQLDAWKEAADISIPAEPEVDPKAVLKRPQPVLVEGDVPDLRGAPPPAQQGPTIFRER